MVNDQELKKLYRETRNELDGIKPTFQAIENRNVDQPSRLPVFAASFALIAVLIGGAVMFNSTFTPPQKPTAEIAETGELPLTFDGHVFAEWEAPTDFLLEHDALDTETLETTNTFDEFEDFTEL